MLLLFLIFIILFCLLQFKKTPLESFKDISEKEAMERCAQKTNANRLVKEVLSELNKQENQNKLNSAFAKSQLQNEVLNQDPDKECDANCQNKKKKYEELIQKSKTLPDELWKAKYDYLSYYYGPDWYDGYKTETAELILQKYQEKKQKQINSLINKYMDKLKVTYSQQKLINNLNNTENEINSKLSQNINLLRDIQDISTTNDRKLLYHNELLETKQKFTNIFIYLFYFLLFTFISVYFISSKNS